MHLVKLGGSVITNKKRLRTFRVDVAKRLTKEIKESAKRTILVHGAGSFGHILASEYELQRGFFDKKQIEGFSKVQADVRALNLKLVKISDAMGLKPVSIPPAATLLCEDKKIINFNSALFEACTILGLTPITFGDMVFDLKIGFCICSGDDLMLQLSNVFRPEKAVFVADTDGIFDKNPRVHEDANLLRCIDQKVLGDLKEHVLSCAQCRKSARGDATGGILRKVEIMLKISQLGVESILLNGLQPSRLKDCLLGKEVIGTAAEGNVE